MRLKIKYEKDEIFLQSRARHLITAAFLSALKRNLTPEKAFKIASEGFANYMISYYELILSSTKRGSQERFDKFRQHYEDYARNSTYLTVIRSKPDLLSVRFDRCPFAEVMAEHGVGDLSYAFCLSDYAFTDKLLPGVKLYRTHEIVKGDQFCDHTWIFQKE